MISETKKFDAGENLDQSSDVSCAVDLSGPTDFTAPEMGTDAGAIALFGGPIEVPEAELQVFSEQLAGKDAIELGCGTAWIYAWLSRHGARVVGIDNSEAQLGTALLR